MSPRAPSFLSFLFRRSLPNDYLTIQLERASKGDICPVCVFEGESRYIWIWSFLWENVNDPDARDEFIAAGGLCPADLWRTVEVARNVIKNSLGVAMVFQHLVKIITRALETGRSGEPWISTAQWRFNLGVGCQACGAAENAVRRCASRLVLAATVPTPPGWLDSAFPLCLTHFKALNARATRSETRSRLCELQNAGIGGQSKLRRSANGIRRLEAAVLPLSGFCPVPAKSTSLYINASERCSTCERLIRLEEEAPAPESRVHCCLAHYRSTSTQGTALYAHFTPDEETHKPSEGCPACVQHRDLENEAIEHTAAQVREFGARDLLCLTHLTRVQAVLSREEGEMFIRDQVERLNSLIGELEDFIALHDYRYGRQPAENPDSPYRWALRFLASEPSNVAHLLPVGGSERFLATRRREMGLRPRP